MFLTIKKGYRTQPGRNSAAYCAALLKRRGSQTFAFGQTSVLADYAALIRPTGYRAERIEYEAVTALQNGADRVFLDRSIGVSTGAGPATGLLARRPDLIIEESGIFSAIEVASKAQAGDAVAARAAEGLEAALGYGEARGINSVGFTLPWSIGGVRTIGASSLPAAYGLGTAGALDVGIGATTSSPAK